LRAPNPGIAARLSISFTAVVILAVSANLVVEHGAFVIETIRTRAATPIVRETPHLVPAAPRVSISAPASLQPEAVAPLPHAEVLDAFGQFERAVLLRAQADTPENQTLLRSANDHLSIELASFVGRAREALLAQKDMEALASLVRKARAAADGFIKAGDSRRASLLAYRNHFENVDATFKQTLDHTWKIFGRIIARESLVTLSRLLDEIRRKSAQLSPDGGYNSKDLDALADAEAAFASALDQHGADLSRSQGTTWVAHVREEFGELISSRHQLAAADQASAAAFRDFEHQRDLAASLIRSIARSAKQRWPNPSSKSPSAVTVAAPEPQRAAATTPIYAPSLSSSTTQARYGFTSSDRALIGGISAAVLLLLLAVSIRTVYSIVRPIREFLSTSYRLTRGDAAARFPRGGLRELDSLAIALNEMAATLETAQAITREYSGGLELRLQERTRQLEQLARSDLLTGLPNTQQLMQHLEELVGDAAGAGHHVAVFLLGLDNFKDVNDTMGHSFGDQLLRAVAGRLTSFVGSTGFVARIGGDEFAIVHAGSETREQLANYGTEVIAAFRAPLEVEGRELLITLSAGFCSYPQDGSSAELLVKAADAALFRAKEQGRDQLSAFSPELLESASEKFNTAQGLRRALERNELELVYQPEVSLESGGVHSVEALLRWSLPDGRRLSPMQFLSSAQESGLINRIGDWVLRSAIERAAAWHQGAWPGVRVAINVSASQLLSGSFGQRVRDLLAEHRLPPHCIEIELTETVLQTGAACIDALRELRETGVGVALDDFGTGFSSLASLQHLPLTRVKLDQTLIAAIDSDSRALAIANAIAGLSGKLGLAITAEGIERSNQLALLLEHRSICVQGYLLSRPVEADAVPAMVSAMPQRLNALTSEVLLGTRAPATIPASECLGSRPIELVPSQGEH
jgi:diguanylate cyclase (GGDEF)-like protein